MIEINKNELLMLFLMKTLFHRYFRRVVVSSLSTLYSDNIHIILISLAILSNDSGVRATLDS